MAPPPHLFRLGNPGLANLLVTGGEGAERERVARIFHDSGRLRLGSFVAARARTIDWAPSLLGALSQPPRLLPGSVLPRAEGGTLFLDEIDELDLGEQRLLLEFLQRGRSSGARDAGWAGLIAAGSAFDLANEVAAGRFLAPLLDALDKIRIDLGTEDFAWAPHRASTSC